MTPVNLSDRIEYERNRGSRISELRYLPGPSSERPGINLSASVSLSRRPCTSFDVSISRKRRDQETRGGTTRVEVAAAEPPISICAFRRSTAGIERELLVIHAFPVSEP